MLVTCKACGAKNRVPASRAGETPKCGQCKQPVAAQPLAAEGAADFDALVASATVPVVVDFWAAWCGPCRQVAPELEKLAAGRAGKVVVAKVDTEALPEVAGRYGIQGIPTFIVFEGGREVRRASGAMPAEQLARALGV